jgi:hypothetical protein
VDGDRGFVIRPSVVNQAQRGETALQTPALGPGQAGGRLPQKLDDVIGDVDILVKDGQLEVPLLLGGGEQVEARTDRGTDR